MCLTFTSKLLSLYLQLHIYTRVHYSPHACIVRIILHFEHLTVHALHYIIKRTGGIFDPPMQVMIKLCNVMVHSMEPMGTVTRPDTWAAACLEMDKRSPPISCSYFHPHDKHTHRVTITHYAQVDYVHVNDANA